MITVAGCPVLWKSQLQSKTATRTMQSEVIDLAAFGQEIITIIVMVDDVGADVGLAQSEKSRMHV